MPDSGRLAAYTLYPTPPFPHWLCTLPGYGQQDRCGNICPPLRGVSCNQAERQTDTGQHKKDIQAPVPSGPHHTLAGRYTLHLGQGKGIHGIHGQQSGAGGAAIVETPSKGVMPLAAEAVSRFSLESAADTSDRRLVHVFLPASRPESGIGSPVSGLGIRN